MSYYELIKETLEHIEQIPNVLRKKNLFLSLGVESLDKGIPKDSIVFPIMEIHPLRNNIEEVIDYKFFMHLIFP